ncbi:MAG: potassium transporter Kup [Gammaproteobacteria bacterium]|nr:potassium transporter Kup [Gammaproteobacteria bacterium]
MPVSARNTSSQPLNRRSDVLAFIALGVVFGDIGTSPLYAFRECFSPKFGVAVTPDNILGLLSLILWALIIVISIKYVSVMLRADNRGEGGVLALLTLVLTPRKGRSRAHPLLLAIGIFGAGLFYGDGMITPAISVLSATEGLQVAAPLLQPVVVPAAIVILALLFFFQGQGTQTVGGIFAPVMAVWFVVLALLGFRWVIQVPEVLVAINPLLAADFLARNHMAGFVVLAAAFLVVTGGEALYTDLGHFGRAPIRIAWFTLVLPALLLNYFGQGALLIHNPEAADHPFFLLAPSWAHYPMVALATIATVIASQAVISGVFSVTRQALQLGYLPRLEVRHSSSAKIGQVYVPAVNGILAVGTVSLVLAFGSSSNLAGAYGVAIATAMLIDTLLVITLFLEKQWGWNTLAAVAAMVCVLPVDLAFSAANLFKVAHGGWFPLAVATAIYIVMTTWREGRQVLSKRLRQEQMAVDDFLKALSGHPPTRVPGTAVFMDRNAAGIPRTLLHNLKHNCVLHECVILLTVVIDEIPRVARDERIEIEKHAPDFVRLTAHCGFMETPDVPAILRQAEAYGMDYKPMETTFFFAREDLVLTGQSGIQPWRKYLFNALMRNAESAAHHFGIPPNRVIEIGAQIRI